MPSGQFTFDAVNLGADFAKQILMHRGRLLRERGNERFVHGVLDMSVDERGQMSREDLREMRRDVRTNEQFLQLDRQAL